MSGIHATFKFNDSKTQLFVASNVTVAQVKQTLHTVFNILPPEMEIFYNGNFLKDDDEFVSCGCTSDSILIVERVCPVPIDSIEVLRSFILSGSLSLIEESNIELYLKQWFESFEDLSITIKSYKLQDAPSITYILLVFENEAEMKSAYDIAPATIFDVEVTKQQTSIYKTSMVNKTVSHLLQKTFTATNQIASTVKDTYNATLKSGVDQIAGETKQIFSDLNENLHIQEGIQSLTESVRQFDSQYKISSNIGSFFSSSMGYLKSFGSTIDSQLNSNEHTQGIYNELKDAVKGISSGVIETVRDANVHATTEIRNEMNRETKMSSQEPVEEEEEEPESL